jgi:ankyrin repeat protein
MNTSDCERLCAASIAGDLETIDRILGQDDSLVDCHGQVREDHRPFMTDQGAESGWTPLHLASCYGQTRAVRRLIEGGANVNAVAENSIAGTPLHTATAGGQPKCVKVILNHGPDLGLKDSAGTTALELARANGVTKITALIEKA